MSPLIVLAGLGGVVLGAAGWELWRRRSQQDTNHERHLEAIIEAEPECVKTVSADGRLLQMNPAGLRLIEVDDFASVQGANVFDLLHPDSLDAFTEMHRAVLAGQTRSLRFQIIGLKGTVRWMETTAVPLTLAHREVVHLAITRDISRNVQREADLAAARAAAEAASRAKSLFLANMSHEIRTPLTAIIGYADVAQRSADPDLKAEALSTIQENGEHLHGILSDFLDLSKIESGRLTIEPLPTNINTVIREVQSLLARPAESKGITLSVEAAPLPMVLTDPVRLRQILLNLAGNAIKFTEAGTVTVQASGHEDSSGQIHVQVVVKDSGIGMSAAQLERVFEPFQQADSSTSRRFGGTGLGLSISARLAAHLGGTLRGASVVGEGSTMTLELSLPRAAAPHPQAAEPLSVIEGLRVLLAEDNPINARLVTLMLAQQGASVLHVSDGVAAIEALKQQAGAFDVVLMDMQMPVLDGYQATEQLRHAGCRVPIIALTANSMSSDRERCMSAGCDDFVTKPIDRATLARTCARWAASAYAAQRPLAAVASVGS